MSISSGTAGVSFIQFGDTDDANVGSFKYDNNANSFAFDTNASERMRIDSSGKVGIGRTSPNEALEIAGSVYLTSNTSNANEGNALKFQSKTGGFNTSYGAAIHGLRVGDTSS